MLLEIGWLLEGVPVDCFSLASDDSSFWIQKDATEVDLIF